MNTLHLLCTCRFSTYTSHSVAYVTVPTLRKRCQLSAAACVVHPTP